MEFLIVAGHKGHPEWTIAEITFHSDGRMTCPNGSFKGWEKIDDKTIRFRESSGKVSVLEFSKMDKKFVEIGAPYNLTRTFEISTAAKR